MVVVIGAAAVRILASGMAAVTVLAGCNGNGGNGGNGSGGNGTTGVGQAAPASPAAASTTTTAAPAVLAELPVPRTEVAGATWSGRLAVAGGLTPDGGASALVHLYNPASGGWDAAPPLPVPLHHAGMAVLRDRLYVAGGYTNGPGAPWVPQAAMRSLGHGEDRWRDEATLPGGARGALGLAATAGFLVAAGGESGGQPLARTELYNPETRAWTAGPDLSRPREHLAVAAVDDWVYAIAGRTSGEGNFTIVESLAPGDGRSWRKEPDLEDSRGGIGAASVDGRLCVAGGEEEAGTISSVECLDGDRWVQAARLAHPRHGLAVMALDGRLHVVAGGDHPGLFVSGTHEALDV